VPVTVRKKCAPRFDKLGAKDVWEAQTMEPLQTLPDVFSGAPLIHSEYASDSLLALTRDNIRLSHLDTKALNNFRVANRMSLRTIHDLQFPWQSFSRGVRRTSVGAPACTMNLNG